MCVYKNADDDFSLQTKVHSILNKEFQSSSVEHPHQLSSAEAIPKKAGWLKQSTPKL